MKTNYVVSYLGGPKGEEKYWIESDWVGDLAEVAIARKRLEDQGFETRVNEFLEIASFNGGYGRRGSITLEKCECCVCHEVRSCIVIDGSEREYSPGSICHNCITSAFNP